MKTKLFFIGLVFITMTTLAGAQNPGAGQGNQTLKHKCPSFVDNNKNGICDNYENRSQNANAGTDNVSFTGNGGGRQQCNRKCGMRHESGNNRNFVDSDKNGICDFRETPQKK